MNLKTMLFSANICLFILFNLPAQAVLELDEQAASGVVSDVVKMRMAFYSPNLDCKWVKAYRLNMLGAETFFTRLKRVCEEGSTAAKKRREALGIINCDEFIAQTKTQLSTGECEFYGAEVPVKPPVAEPVSEQPPVEPASEQPPAEPVSHEKPEAGPEEKADTEKSELSLAQSASLLATAIMGQPSSPGIAMQEYFRCLDQEQDRKKNCTSLNSIRNNCRNLQSFIPRLRARRQARCNYANQVFEQECRQEVPVCLNPSIPPGMGGGMGGGMGK